jgi:four helix bundle protein
MADSRNLKVWQKAHALALEVNSAAAGIRSSHHLSLKSQLVRAAFSIPANIVEGRTRQSESEFVRYLRIALNSASELEYHLLAARDIGALNASVHHSISERVAEVAKMLQGLINRVESDGAGS